MRIDGKTVEQMADEILHSKAWALGRYRECLIAAQEVAYYEGVREGTVEYARHMAASYERHQQQRLAEMAKRLEVAQKAAWN